MGQAGSDVAAGNGQAVLVGDAASASKGVDPSWASTVLDNRRRLRDVVRLMAVFTDCAAICVSFMVGSFIRLQDPFHDQVVLLVSAVLPIYLIVSAHNRSFSLDTIAHSARSAMISCYSYMVTVAIVALVIFFLKTGDDLSRAIFGSALLLAFIALPLFRMIPARLARNKLQGIHHNEVIIEDDMCLPKRTGGLVLKAGVDGISPQLNPRMLDKVGRSLKLADRVIVACSPERRAMWSLALRGLGIRAEVMAPELDGLGSLGIGSFENGRTLVIASGPLGITDRLLKRMLDLVLVVACLPVMLPLMALVALAIKLDSGGPIFFVQDRVGLGNRIFKMYKFRSMKVAHLDFEGDRSTERGDSRITRVGRFIRASSIDELPQILNVLLGDMSIVGPRPHALGSKAGDQLFWELEANYWERHAVKPGLTGLAQIRGFRGATETAEDVHNRIGADLEYLADWSVWKDLTIIAATFRVLVHKKAY